MKDKIKMFYIYDIRMKYGISNSKWWKVNYIFTMVTTYFHSKEFYRINHGKHFKLYKK